jgi:glycosyltransferase involved in cell wall biosynthesis
VKILHLYKDYFPVLGGIENHIRMLAEAQAARGHEVSVLVTSRDRRTHVETINRVRVTFAARLATVSSAPISLELFARLAAERADVVHLQFPYPWGELANYWFGHAHKTVLTYQSDIVRQRYLRVLYTPLMQRVLRRADAIIATSPNYVMTSPVLSRWRQKCLVVPLGIDPSPYSRPPKPLPASLPSASLRGSSTWKGGEWEGEGVLLFVGRLRYYKGLNYLLRAMRELPEARLVVVGTGPMERKWKNLARELGLVKRVHFAGEVSDADLPAYYAACDVFVLPCSERSEAFGMVQLEAMAAGKPVVSCDVGTGVAWVNQNEVTGLVVPPRDPAALANAIRRLLANKELREKLGASGRVRVQEEFTIEKMVEGVMRVYEQAISG